MAIQLGSAYGKVSLDVKNFLFGIDQGKAGIKGLSETATKLGADMKRIGQAMTVGLTLPIAAMGVTAVKAASDLNETMNKVDVVFKEQSKTVMDWAKNSATAFGMSKQEALEAAATFGNLFTAMGEGREISAEMSTKLVTLAGDLASFNNIDPSVALLKLKSGIVGETEAVRDLGIDLRQTVVEARATEMGFKAVNGVFQQGDLIAARYALIMEQTANAQGDFTRTSNGLANQMRILNAQWKDALATLGVNLLPIALKVVQTLNKMLEAFNKLSPWQQKVILGFILLVAAIGPLLIIFGTLLPMIHMTTRSLNPLSGGILGLVFGFVKLVAAASIVVKILEFFGVATGPIGAGILGLNAAIAGTGAAILTAFLPVLAVIASLILLIGIFAVAWKTNFLGIRDIMATSVKFWTNILKAFFAFLKGDTAGATEYLKTAFQSLVDHINNVFLKLFGIRDAWGSFMNFMRNALSSVVTYISNIFTKTNWAQLGKYITFGIANGMLLGIPSLIIAATRAAESALAAIKAKLGIKSPSKAFEQLGIFSAQGYQLGLAKAMTADGIANAMARPVNQLSNSQQQNITMQFGSGLTLQQVRGMIDANSEQMINTIVNALGGA